VGGPPPQRHRVPAGVRDRLPGLHPAAAVIQVRLAAPRRAAGVTGLILGAALLRSLLLPLGDLFSTSVFAGCLLAITWFERSAPTLPSPRGGGKLATFASAGGGRKLAAALGGPQSMVAGLLGGAVPLAPHVNGAI